MKPEQSPVFLTAVEVGEILGLKKARVYELAHEGYLPFVRLGKRRMYFPASGLRVLSEEAIARVRD